MGRDRHSYFYKLAERGKGRSKEQEKVLQPEGREEMKQPLPECSWGPPSGDSQPTAEAAADPSARCVDIERWICTIFEEPSNRVIE